MEPKENEQIFSEGGYSIWKMEPESHPDQNESNESQKPFVVKNCFGTDISEIRPKRFFLTLILFT